MRYTIKQILLSDGNWWRFYNKFKTKLRDAIPLTIAKLLSCRNVVRGYHEYRCSQPDCNHVKRIYHTCKSRLCSSCGRKNIEQWLAKQNSLLPDTSWQHITFTMPSELWDFFWCNRFLLNELSAIAAECIQTLARTKNVIPGIFVALHTFGRDLKKNVHLHLSTPMGGISRDTLKWIKLFFHQNTLMKMWRYKIIQLFRREAARLTIPPSIQLSPIFTLNHFLDRLYRKHWIVHCAPPDTKPHRMIEYLARYLKRPPIAESKILHYDGNEVTFRYLEHESGRYRNKTLTTENFIKKLIQHIPDEGFRLIRYYGFLSNRLRKQYLPLVKALLDSPSAQPEITPPPSFESMMEKYFHINPLDCILCGSKMLLSAVTYGKTSRFDLMQNHRALALMKKCE